jgi:glycine hydroxymethyltransferase
MNRWMTQAARQRIEELSAVVNGATSDEVARLVTGAVVTESDRLARRCINLYAGANTPNPQVTALLGSSLGSRPSLGHPGEKYNVSMEATEIVEVAASSLLCRLFGATYAEHRVASGSLANLYAFMATCRPGDRIMAFGDAAAGHPTHHANGAAGLYGLEVHEVPFDAAAMDVDIEALGAAAERLRPRLIIVAGSMCLFPYDLAGVRRVADAVGARVLYDAAHMGGIIAGGAFQQPLADGAHLMTGSTYKSFGGPPAGFVVTNDDELAERLDAIAYPGLTANFDLSRTAALAIACLDLVEHGPAYAGACLANAHALAAGLAARGVAVHQVAGKGFTASQHVAVRADTYGGGDTASHRLAPSGILMSSIGLPGPAVAGENNAIRLGTQEVTRWGFATAEMDQVAAWMAEMLVGDGNPAALAGEVADLRGRFATLHYVRS